MPLYDYKCPFCEHEAEIQKGINNEDPVYCPNVFIGEIEDWVCKTKMERQFKPTSVLLKGLDNTKG